MKMHVKKSVVGFGCLLVLLAALPASLDSSYSFYVVVYWTSVATGAAFCYASSVQYRSLSLHVLLAASLAAIAILLLRAFPLSFLQPLMIGLLATSCVVMLKSWMIFVKAAATRRQGQNELHE